MNNIEHKINEFFDKLENDKVCIEYVKVKDRLVNNNEIMKLLKEIKRYQKICTNNKDPKLEKDLKELYEKLESYPLYQSYLIKKDELNDELYIIKDIFEKYFKELLNLDLTI